MIGIRHNVHSNLTQFKKRLDNYIITRNLMARNFKHHVQVTIAELLLQRDLGGYAKRFFDIYVCRITSGPKNAFKHATKQSYLQKQLTEVTTSILHFRARSTRNIPPFILEVYSCSTLLKNRTSKFQNAFPRGSSTSPLIQFYPFLCKNQPR